MTTNPRRKLKTKAGMSENGKLFFGRWKAAQTTWILGEWQMEAITHFPERLKKGRQVFLGEEKLPATIESLRGHVDRLLVRFSGLWDQNIILKLRNQYIYIKTEELPDLPKDHYYHHEILGMTVEDEQGKVIGKVAEILETGANDVYVIRKGDDEVLIPAIMSVVLKVDKSNNLMVVKLQEWI